MGNNKKIILMNTSKKNRIIHEEEIKAEMRDAFIKVGFNETAFIIKNNQISEFFEKDSSIDFPFSSENDNHLLFIRRETSRLKWKVCVYNQCEKGYTYVCGELIYGVYNPRMSAEAIINCGLLGLSSHEAESKLLEIIVRKELESILPIYCLDKEGPKVIDSAEMEALLNLCLKTRFKSFGLNLSVTIVSRIGQIPKKDDNKKTADGDVVFYKQRVFPSGLTTERIVYLETSDGKEMCIRRMKHKQHNSVGKNNENNLGQFFGNTMYGCDSFGNMCNFGPGTDSYFYGMSCFGGVSEPKYDANEATFRAAAPDGVSKGEYFPLNIVMFGEEYRQKAERQLALTAKERTEAEIGTLDVDINSRVAIRVFSPDIEIDDNVCERTWNGKMCSFQYSIYLPEEYDKKSLTLRGRIQINGADESDIILIVKVEKEYQEIHTEIEKLLSAFVSYSSADRALVAARLQGMLAATNNEMDIFFDVESLRRGSEWEKEIIKEIKKRKLFYLFWSRNAQKSEYVRKELEWALQYKGEQFIEPVPLEDPEMCAPPESLKHKHFFDRLLNYTNAPKANENKGDE